MAKKGKLSSPGRVDRAESVADAEKRKGECQSIEREVRVVKPARSMKNTPISGAIKPGKIPFSARGSSS